MSLHSLRPALFAGFVLTALAAPAAQAAGPDIRSACRYAAAPQGYGDSLRYLYCMRQIECLDRADREGRTVFGDGCFGIAPEQPRPAAAPR